MVKIAPFLRKYSENRLDPEKWKLLLIERQITDQLVNRNVKFVNKAQRVSGHRCPIHDIIMFV